MKNTITLFILAMVLVSCNSVKKSQKFLNSGNYDQAIHLLIKKLQKDGDNSRRDTQILILEEAFNRVAREDEQRINFLLKENLPSSAREIYNTYADLSDRQAYIDPILPLYIESEGRNANFKFEDYSDELIEAKQAYIDYLYDEGAIYMQRQAVKDYRTAYNIYCELDKLQAHYKDVDQLRGDARFYGTNFIFVTLNNRSGQIIPRRLERELLDFNTYGLDQFWTEYHSERQSDIQYNYGIAFNFQDILISPERITEEIVKRRKIIKVDREDTGRAASDSTKSKQKDLVVRATLNITSQTKSVLVGGTVVYRDLINRRDIDRHPLSSEFIFENVFARLRGDERALSNEDLRLLENEFIPFPSNEQMVLDAGTDVKAQLANILKNNSF